MARLTDPVLFQLIHDYLTTYLPSQRCCSPNTIKASKTSLRLMLEFAAHKNDVGFADIRFAMLNKETVSSFLDWLETDRNCSAATRNQRLACIRAFFSYAASMDPTAVIRLLELQKIPYKKTPTSEAVDYMSENAVKALLAQPDTHTKNGLRDQFFMVLMYDTAARVQEILDLKIRDIRTGKVPVAKLCGKGSKTRTVPLMQKTIEHFSNYMRAFHSDTDNYSDDYLFYVIRGGSKLPMSDDNVRKIMKKYGAAAKAVCPEVPKNVHPHLWRHSRAMHLYQHGMDLTLISQWLGHAHFETTLIYAHADTEQKRKAIAKAMTQTSPLSESESVSRYEINDEEMLKRLYGLL